MARRVVCCLSDKPSGFGKTLHTMEVMHTCYCNAIHICKKKILTTVATDQLQREE